jgi:hypothetical protein
MQHAVCFWPEAVFQIYSSMMTISLPVDLRRFIAERGLFEGFTRSDRPGCVELWSIDDIPEQNASIEIDVYAPGFLAFAGNGGGEVLVFDATGVVYMLPLIGMEPKYAIKIADSFAEFAETFELDSE